MDLPNTRLRRDDPRPMASSPLIVVPIASSVPSRSEPSKVWPGQGGACGKVGTTANLDGGSCARRGEQWARRDEETAVRSNKETDEGEKMRCAGETLDKEHPIQGLLGVHARCGVHTRAVTNS
jgi:hypothetical protein